MKPINASAARHPRAPPLAAREHLAAFCGPGPTRRFDEIGNEIGGHVFDSTVSIHSCLLAIFSSDLGIAPDEGIHVDLLLLEELADGLEGEGAHADVGGAAGLLGEVVDEKVGPLFEAEFFHNSHDVGGDKKGSEGLGGYGGEGAPESLL
eukprot:CAMPEP_0184710408 /NCGR_PEP_ID=MMETSP0314-20130426/1224_1 /TAXON_ID=38298 /ORGANISM="Rhodella maculata, Strain CCMP 736" /LENGTH=149 /DNA_ID=CAMNT_0027172241 /DNA_START=468 /DNA_END=918 /DNA_ORIENTATION=-